MFSPTLLFLTFSKIINKFTSALVSAGLNLSLSKARHVLFVPLFLFQSFLIFAPWDLAIPRDIREQVFKQCLKNGAHGRVERCWITRDCANKDQPDLVETHKEVLDKIIAEIPFLNILADKKVRLEKARDDKKKNLNIEKSIAFIRSCLGSDNNGCAVFNKYIKGNSEAKQDKASLFSCLVKEIQPVYLTDALANSFNILKEVLESGLVSSSMQTNALVGSNYSVVNISQDDLFSTFRCENGDDAKVFSQGEKTISFLDSMKSRVDKLGKQPLDSVDIDLTGIRFPLEVKTEVGGKEVLVKFEAGHDIKDFCKKYVKFWNYSDLEREKDVFRHCFPKEIVEKSIYLGVPVHTAAVSVSPVRSSFGSLQYGRVHKIEGDKGTPKGCSAAFALPAIQQGSSRSVLFEVFMDRTLQGVAATIAAKLYHCGYQYLNVDGNGLDSSVDGSTADLSGFYKNLNANTPPTYTHEALKKLLEDEWSVDARVEMDMAINGNVSSWLKNPPEETSIKVVESKKGKVVAVYDHLSRLIYVLYQAQSRVPQLSNIP